MFGEILKKIRKENGDSLRGLGEKIDVAFTYIDKIERGYSPINKPILEKLIKEYPLRKNELMEAYLIEVMPENENIHLKEIFNKNNTINKIYETLLTKLTNEEKKDFLNNLIEKIELKSLKNGNYEEDKKQIEIIKELITKI